ncbi:hypothetical protein OEZ85_004582 [Tetradesmus obliquus]|uniref:Uncharacterized protein n=1 Tax=Tetradesmus obliquus TaxID=3088 RepID=A0ABY8ULV0_TETOB|nr:hypothetical protein OEZ85_004582 [Tetradesmus obliquus]
MVGNAYNMNGRFGVDPAQLKAMGLPDQYLQAAQTLRNNFRQGLADLTQGSLLANASLAGIGNGSIAQSIMSSAVPMTLAQDGTPQLPLLNAVGTWLGQRVQEAVKGESQPGGRLAGLLNIATPSGRKLQQLEETPLGAAAAAGDEESIDAAAAAVRDIERIRAYVADLARLAAEVMEHADPEDDEEEDAEVMEHADPEDDDDEDGEL